MALIDLLNINKNYSAQKILINTTFNLEEGERVVIVGKNGSGKSTLMKIASGSLDFDEGDRITRQGLEIKMLDQVPKFKDGATVREAVEDGLGELKTASARFDELSLLLAEDFENEELLKEHSEISAVLYHHSAWNLDDKIERILEHFQLKAYENKNINLLSGGEQRRVALAGLLLLKPDVLLLDEPTNHLDVYMVEFLEDLLLREKFTLLFISHDRYFIDRIATRTVEVENGDLRVFRGGYSNYLTQKAEIMRTMQKQHENLLKYLKTENEWYARGVRARLKRNEGRKARLMDLRDAAKTNPAQIRKMKVELEREQKNFQRDKSINKQKMLFEVENLSYGIANKQLIKDFSIRILQKDVIAIVGPNGSGKSTLLKLLLDRIQPDHGKIDRGEFKIGYFDQHREMLDDSKNLIETFCPDGGDRVYVQGQSMHVYGYLKNFLFPREYLEKKIGVLSGGEKNRIALALLFTKQVDIMILDEPTNDLDIPTINILEEKLQNFPGAVVIVSHDRYFVDKIAKKLLIFKGQGHIEESFQEYSEYLNIEKALNSLAEFENSPEQKKAVIENMDKTLKKEVFKLSYKEKEALKSLPDAIEALEKKIEELNNCLADPACYQEIGLTKISQELEDKENQYEEMVEELLRIEEKSEMIDAK